MSHLDNRAKAGHPVNYPKIPGVQVGHLMGLGAYFNGEFWVHNCRDRYYTKGYIRQRHFNYNIFF
jgi:hypothetical protein